MGQPFIKFIAHTTGYLIFIGLVIAETQKVGYDISAKKFSSTFPQYEEIFSKYVTKHLLNIAKMLLKY